MYNECDINSSSLIHNYIRDETFPQEDLPDDTDDFEKYLDD